MGISITLIGGLAAYVLTSTLFWRHPTLIHKKKKCKFVAHHISHRGGSGEGYENTIKTFARSAATGTEMLEMDVRLTKDGKVVVIHDEDLFRLTGLKFKVREVNYEDIPPISKEILIDTLPGQTYKDLSWTDRERRVPLLRSVFTEFPTIPINIDIKDQDQSIELVDKVSRLITEFKREDITVWGSFFNKTTEYCYNKNPNVGLFFSMKRVVILGLLTITGLLPFFPIKETHYEIILPIYHKKRMLYDEGELGLRNTFILWLESIFVWNPLISHLQRRGIQIYIWVLNSEEEFERSLQVGADGIMTDYPTKLKKFLNLRIKQGAK